MSNTSEAQIIRSFDCLISQEDSSSATYSVKVKFDSIGDKEKRLELVKEELERKYQIKTDKIISIESFVDKKYLTYRYRVKVKNYSLKD